MGTISLNYNRFKSYYIWKKKKKGTSIKNLCKSWIILPFPIRPLISCVLEKKRSIQHYSITAWVVNNDTSYPNSIFSTSINAILSTKVAGTVGKARIPRPSHVELQDPISLYTQNSYLIFHKFSFSFVLWWAKSGKYIRVW